MKETHKENLTHLSQTQQKTTEVKLGFTEKIIIIFRIILSHMKRNKLFHTA